MIRNRFSDRQKAENEHCETLKKLTSLGRLIQDIKSCIRVLLL